MSPARKQAAPAAQEQHVARRPHEPEAQVRHRRHRRRDLGGNLGGRRPGGPDAEAEPLLQRHCAVVLLPAAAAAEIHRDTGGCGGGGKGSGHA